MKRGTIIELIASLYALLFVYASVSKVINFQEFRVQLGKSPLLTAYAGAFAVFVPLLEIAVSLLLAVPLSRRVGLYASFCLMVMFTTYIIMILHFSEYIPCSCGGILQNMTWGQHLVFNIFFIIPAVIAILLFPNQSKVIAFASKSSKL
jgi:uncharacterized membrane protein YphA (DoxX/SURF4 family)